MKQGFSLIELLLALLISSFIITGLFTVIYQVRRMQTNVNTITGASERAAIMLNQLERDLMGAFVPTHIEPLKQTKKQPGSTAQDVTPPLKKIFFGITRDNRLDTLSFITCNPLQVYTKAKDAKIKPRIVRIVYRVLPDPDNKKSYVLMRQEGTELDYDRYTRDAQGALRAYRVVDGIATIRVMYFIPDPKGKMESENPVITYRKVSGWQDTDKEGKNVRGLPHYVEFSFTLWDSVYERQMPFTMTIPILGDTGQTSEQSEETIPVLQESAKPAEQAVNMSISGVPTVTARNRRAVSTGPTNNAKSAWIEELPADVRSAVTIREAA